MIGSRDRRATGIHIIDNTLRIVEVGVAGQVLALHALAQEELPNPFVPAQLDNREQREELAQVLRQVRADRGIRFDHPVVALNSPLFYLKHRPLMQAGRRANRRHLFWEAHQFLGDESTEYGIDCALTQHGGFVVAARRYLLDLYMDVFDQAGIENLDFDIAPFALYNAFETTDLLSDERPELLVDIALSEASIILIRDGEFAAVASWSWEDGLDADRRLADLEERIGALVGEVSETEWPQRMWLAGVAARESNWDTELPDRFSMPGALLDPFQDVDQSPLSPIDAPLLEAKSEFAVPAGLAFRGLFG